MSTLCLDPPLLDNAKPTDDSRRKIGKRQKAFNNIIFSSHQKKKKMKKKYVVSNLSVRATILFQESVLSLKSQQLSLQLLETVVCLRHLVILVSKILNAFHLALFCSN